MKVVGRIARGTWGAVRTRPGVFVAVATSVLVLDVFLPPVVLSVARKPWNYFTFNPWLRSLPGYLTSGRIPLGQKFAFLPHLAVFWFSADGPFEPEWGFAVDVSDILRFVLMALVFGAYFALWSYRRDLAPACGRPSRAARHGGTLGAIGSVLALSTGPCGVMGCGAPVIPVVGLAFAGLSSTALAFLESFSRIATVVVLVAATLGVLHLAWLVGESGAARPQSAR